MTKPLVIFHSLGPTGHCDDGFAAALAVRLALGASNVDFAPAEYGKEPPDVRGRNVIMVDISYKRPVLEGMLKSCRSLLILDHHKTAAEELAFMRPGPSDWITWQAWQEGGGGAAVFDMDRAGAGLAWDFFHPGRPRPGFIDYIECRDLGGGLDPGRPTLPGLDQFVRALRSYPQDFDAWENLLTSPVGDKRLISEGLSIERYFRTLVEQAKRAAYVAVFDDYGTELGPCRITNCPKFAASEVAGELAEGVSFGAVYFEAAPGRWEYSLRSRGENATDVSAIAKRFGGGGHHKAAGFTMPCIIHKPI
jgi:uncharacterized protein